MDANSQGCGGRFAQAGEHVSTLGHAGSPWSKAWSRACSSSLRCEGGIPCHAQEDLESEAPLKKARAALARAVVGSRLLYGASTWQSLSATDIGAMVDTCMAAFRTIVNERWRPRHVLASSQEVFRLLGILDFQEAVSMQRFRLAARLVNAAPSLMALLQSDAGRAWKDNLARDLALLRQEMGPQLAEVDGLPDFERLWFEYLKAWKQLLSSCQRKLVERRLRSGPSQPAPVHVLPTFSCDQCDVVYGKLRALRTDQMGAHQRRREARGCVLASVCPVCMADFWSRPRGIQHLEVGARRCAPAWKHGLEPYSDDAVAAADQLDCEHLRRCKREGRSHLAGPPMIRNREGGE